MRTLFILFSVAILNLMLLQPAWTQYEDVVAHAKPAVVLIYNEMSQGASVGTGFFIDAGGYIATNRHVIADANRLTVLSPDGRRLPAWVVRYSNNFDAAIIKVAGTEFPTLPLGDSDGVRQGQEVLVIGYPGLAQRGRGEWVPIEFPKRIPLLFGRCGSGSKSVNRDQDPPPCRSRYGSATTQGLQRSAHQTINVDCRTEVVGLHWLPFSSLLGT